MKRNIYLLYTFEKLIDTEIRMNSELQDNLVYLKSILNSMDNLYTKN